MAFEVTLDNGHLDHFCFVMVYENNLEKVYLTSGRPLVPENKQKEGAKLTSQRRVTKNKKIKMKIGII